MMPRRAEYPEVGDLVVCSVENVKNFGAFVKLDEYGGKEGFIHVRDVATGWVKYIRDHIREGQKVVCKVLGVDPEKGHIDLSLKQVNEHARREKIQEWKNEKKAEKLLEIAASKLGKSLDQAYAEVGDKLIADFGTLYSAFEQMTKDPDSVKGLGLDRKWAGALTEVARENIELPSVSIHGVLELTVPTPDGIDHIKKALAEAEKADEGEVKIHYLGAPRYRVTVTAEDYKVAEAELKSAVERVTTTVHRAGGHASFKRSDEK